MRCDAIVKTHRADLSFLSYSLRFLEKNWREPNSQIIVLANSDCKDVLETWGFSRKWVQYFYVDPWPDGNQFQCYLTLLYDHFSDADLFAVFDSDCILRRPLEASDWMVDGKPIIHCEPHMGDLANDRVVAHRLWFPIMEHWVGQRPRADYMFAFPFLYRADTIRSVRRLITKKTGKGLLESLYSGTPFNAGNFIAHPFTFCEHNVISFYAATHEPDNYHLRSIDEITEEERAHWPVKQYHSWSQWSEATAAELEALWASQK
jgi:hypothetical protein